jgi:hypothetical protein
MAVVASARRKPKRRLPPEILTDPEVLAVMHACGESDTGVRNQARIAIMSPRPLRVRAGPPRRPRRRGGELQRERPCLCRATGMAPFKDPLSG